MRATIQDRRATVSGDSVKPVSSATIVAYAGRIAIQAKRVRPRAKATISATMNGAIAPWNAGWVTRSLTRDDAAAPALRARIRAAGEGAWQGKTGLAARLFLTPRWRPRDSSAESSRHEPTVLAPDRTRFLERGHEHRGELRGRKPEIQP